MQRKTLPVARRVLGESCEITIKMLWNYAETLYRDDSVALRDLREAVNTLDDLARTVRKVSGSAHPFVVGTEHHLRKSRAALRARETPSPGRS